METNETSAGAPAKTAKKPSVGAQEETERKHGCRNGCLLAFLVVAVLASSLAFFFTRLGRMSPKNIAVICRSNLKQAYQSMGRFIEIHAEEGCKIPPDWTIPVLIQEWYYDGKTFFCPAPGTTYREPFLAFPVPASILLNSEQDPLPILMCRPGVHGQYGTPILYSDGTIKNLSTKEAEKLVAEQSPVPLEIKRADFKVRQNAEP